MSFGNDIDKASDDAMKKIDLIRRRCIMRLFNMIVMATPVDEGTLRGNWQTSTSAPRLGTLGVRSPEEVMREVEENLGPLLSTVFFVNNLPYASRIEYEGWSAQAPTGMVRSNVAQWSQIVRSVSKEVNSGI